MPFIVTISNSQLPKYNTQTGLEIYDTSKSISISQEGLLNISGTISYMINDGTCNLLINRNGTYFAIGSAQLTYSIDKENNKFIVEEIDGNLKKTGKNLEYTIDGKNLIEN